VFLFKGNIMGMPGFGKKCWLQPTQPSGNPDPSRWELLDIEVFANSYVLKVKYRDAINFDGVKIMVYKGQSKDVDPTYLDPHFADDDKSPFARFKPTEQGWEMAIELAKQLDSI
jgi:hypothetical protein